MGCRESISEIYRKTRFLDKEEVLTNEEPDFQNIFITIEKMVST